jgi:hypothetical protein
MVDRGLEVLWFCERYYHSEKAREHVRLLARSFYSTVSRNAIDGNIHLRT